MLNFFRCLFLNDSEKSVVVAQKCVKKINEFEPAMRSLDDVALSSLTNDFRNRLKNGESYLQLLPEAFAVVREASHRILGMRHFDVQLIGGYVLFRGGIAEMRTGEGKTLVATLPAYLKALSGKGVHLVTVNDYLAQRDCAWMTPLFNFLGLSVGCISSGMPDERRKAMYACDIVYGTNNEFAFDYLRDHLRLFSADRIQRDLHYAIIDEVDSVLIDEARTPLIISGPSEDASKIYTDINCIVSQLSQDAYEKDEKNNTVFLTEKGTDLAEEACLALGLIKTGSSLYDSENVLLFHHILQSLRAHFLFDRDVHYLVRDGKVVIVDDFTGRAMVGRRYSEGLHQALEAKEGVEILRENQTLASISFQNYFRLYQSLAGMTGTAYTEKDEFKEIYDLSVTVIPTNKPVVRIDHDDEIYATAVGRDRAVLKLVQDCYTRGQPVLVGVSSIERSDCFSLLLQEVGIPHNVLNAREHEREAHIIAEAGCPFAVTIATNMAGRGTDIRLGGNLERRIAKFLEDCPEGTPIEKEKEALKKVMEDQCQRVLESGGLYIIGTERHESRRIDNQLRGRAGRQGDIGESKFFVCLEDSLMRVFATPRLQNFMKKLGVSDEEPITHPWITKALKNAQKKVEARNFDIRKQLLAFDDVLSEQRKVIFSQREDLMDTSDLSEKFSRMAEQVLDELIKALSQETLSFESFSHEMVYFFGQHVEPLLEEPAMRLRVSEFIAERSQSLFTGDEESIIHFRKAGLLHLLDEHWKEHLNHLDHLRHSVNFRVYASKDPLREYKSEAFSLFCDMLQNYRREAVHLIFHKKSGEDLEGSVTVEVRYEGFSDKSVAE